MAPNTDYVEAERRTRAEAIGTATKNGPRVAKFFNPMIYFIGGGIGSSLDPRLGSTVEKV
jgi:hypothetical protein